MVCFLEYKKERDFLWNKKTTKNVPSGAAE